MGKEEIENFPLREIKSFLKGYFRYILICKVIYKYWYCLGLMTFFTYKTYNNNTMSILKRWCRIATFLMAFQSNN